MIHLRALWTPFLLRTVSLKNFGYYGYLIFLSFFFLTTNAHAYLDPGTGSIILQAIVGAFAAFFTSIYIFWNLFS